MPRRMRSGDASLGMHADRGLPAGLGPPARQAPRARRRGRDPGPASLRRRADARDGAALGDRPHESKGDRLGDRRVRHERRRGRWCGPVRLPPDGPRRRGRRGRGRLRVGRHVGAVRAPPLRRDVALHGATAGHAKLRLGARAPGRAQRASLRGLDDPRRVPDQLGGARPLLAASPRGPRARVSVLGVSSERRWWVRVRARSSREPGGDRTRRDAPPRTRAARRRR